jgi:hypothetical protein
VREHGRDALVRLIRSYSDGRTDDEAFKSAIDLDVTGFNEAWFASVDAVEPKVYGPQPAPAGPVPQAWGGPATPARPEPAPTQGVPSRTLVLAAILAIVGLGSIVLVVRSRRRSSPGRSLVPGP